MSDNEVNEIPIQHTDPVNKQILDVSEDQIQGFLRDPITEISKKSGVAVDTVIERIRAMLKAGTIRRVRQTLLATNLARGALVAWKVEPDRLDETFEWMFKNDPFSGHVVVRSTDQDFKGSVYRLWTTLKVPQGYSLDKHCEYLISKTGAEDYRLMPAKGIFALGVGHSRRSNLEFGSRADEKAKMHKVEVVDLSEKEWQVLVPLKREFEPEELTVEPWKARAEEAGLSYEEFCEVAEGLAAKKVIGRFSTFLEHVKPLKSGERVTKFNALFHWAVPEGMEQKAGEEVGRHHVMTHAYWRQTGDEFNFVNIMGVAHGLDKDTVYGHKNAIDQHLKDDGIPIHYTNIFWGGRSEIKPSEIAPQAYLAWCQGQGVDPASMKA